jgi:hypothetical protein
VRRTHGGDALRSDIFPEITMITRLSTLLVAAGAACCAVADADAQSTASLTATPRIIETPLMVPHAVAGVVRYRMTATRPGDTTRVEIGTRTVERHDATVAGARLIHRVLSFVSPRGSVVDSTTCHAESLAPVHERSHQPTKTMSLDFDGAHVTGTVAPKDSAAHAVDMDTTVPVFNSTDADLVVASLPLADGYHAILPFYTYELGGLERDTVTVLRSEKFAGPDGERKAWVTQLADPFLHITYWIDAGTREVLQAEFVRRSDGVVMRMTRF